jgi:hypothetical protein
VKINVDRAPDLTFDEYFWLEMVRLSQRREGIPSKFLAKFEDFEWIRPVKRGRIIVTVAGIEMKRRYEENQ